MGQLLDEAKKAPDLNKITFAVYLRFRHGSRVVKSWYFEAQGDVKKDKRKLIQQLFDGAIFQLIYDLKNISEKDLYRSVQHFV